MASSLASAPGQWPFSVVTTRWLRPPFFSREETKQHHVWREGPLLIIHLLDMATHGRSASVSEGSSSSKYNFPSKTMNFQNQNCHKSRHLHNIRVSESEHNTYYLHFTLPSIALLIMSHCCIYIISLKLKAHIPEKEKKLMM